MARKGRINVSALLLGCLLFLTCRLLALPSQPEGETRTADSLGIIPRPLIGLEGGKIRWGGELSITRIFLPLDALSPWIEAGIRYFERLESHPDDKKSFALRAGLFIPITDIHLSASLGIVTGGGEASPELGLGLWRFFGLAARPRPQLAEYKDYGLWLDADRRWERASKDETVTGLGFGLFVTPGLSPSVVLSLAFAVFL